MKLNLIKKDSILLYRKKAVISYEISIKFTYLHNVLKGHLMDLPRFFSKKLYT